ncbi:type II toxin-antitoxin system RelB/DinJ family antitoxin [uncultured Selenomonas sp.]|jgi:addiction module antitoxin, relB/dinJ family|uniref:type II toxin-antitoxin system RelB/DinJ family antitoxin n=1 Tax=uncultured Selenomonas sp. TaxID=159275 RepID=UPI0028ED9B71|nr:type II toxin-antitoxin system RelB/DinJ family antitoxin [uncultured Selenomonas sp.]
MAQAMVSFRMDAELKRAMEETCRQMGLTLTSAFTMFATKVTQDRRIPFEITAEPDPFYGEENMARLRAAIADVKAGRNLTKHELIEVD